MDKWKSLSPTQKAAIIGVVLVLLIGTIVTITIVNTRDVGKVFYTKTEKSMEMVRNLNRDVDPCKDFYEFACGNFKKNHPYGESPSRSTGYFEMQGKDISAALTKLLQADLPLANQTAPEAYLRRFFKLCNQSSSENDEFDKLRSKINDMFQGSEENANLKQIMAKVNRLGLPSLIAMGVGVDPFDTSKHVIQMGQPGVQAPLIEKVFDAFTKKRTTLKEEDAHRIAAINFIAESIKLIEDVTEGDEEFTKRANETIEFIKYLASLRTFNQSPHLKDIFNKFTLEQLDKLEGGGQFNWTLYLQMVLGEQATLKQTDTIIVGDLNYIKQIPEIMNVNGSKVIEFMKWAIVQSYGFYTGQKFREIAFKFDQATSNEPIHQDNWVNMHCSQAISERANEVLGRMYVKEHITKQDKEDGELLVSNITTTFAKLIEKKDWMDDVTRERALKKLRGIKANVGYPEWLLDNEKLEQEYHFLSKGNLSDSSRLYDLAIYFHESTITDQFEALNDPVDRDHEWPMSPVTINAAYYILQNTITIPASLLRGIFFSRDYPEYVNYGQLGSIIGHELTHAFDVKGSQSDENGNLVDWWTTETHNKFMEKANCFVEQYSRATALLGDMVIHLNGTSTLSENIADNGGVREAFKAWQSQRGDKQEEPLDGLEMFSEEQLFFLAYANNWCIDQDPKTKLALFFLDNHSPAQLRVNFVLANFDEFAKAYSCPEKSNMHPSDKCKVW